jgi:2-dehydro-3-deoxyglucarate aldolase
MELARRLRQRLNIGDVVLGSWLSLGSGPVAEIMARAGFDFLVIDMEHSPTSIETAADLIRIIDLNGCSPLVRVTSNDRHLIKRVLDSGAHGVIVPNVQSAEEAAEAVAATRYSPKGHRGVGLHRAQGYGNEFHEYQAAADGGILVAVQIESEQAVLNISNILAVEGVDAVLIGPYDLSSDLGSPGDFTSPEFVEALESVLDAARSAGVATGFHLVEPDPDQLMNYAAQGHRFLIYSVDMRILAIGAQIGATALEGSS